jgi:hypothetical protein
VAPEFFRVDLDGAHSAKRAKTQDAPDRAAREGTPPRFLKPNHAF